MTPEQVAQHLIRKHDGNYRLALLDLAETYISICNGVSPGFMRMAPDHPVLIPLSDPPAVCDDEWLKTAREA